MNLLMRALIVVAALAMSALPASAAVAPFPGNPTDIFFGCDPDIGFICTVSFDELGHIKSAIAPAGVTLFGNTISVSSVAPPAVVPLDSAGHPVQATSYLIGVSVYAGAIGLCEVGLTIDGTCVGGDLSDVVVFTNLSDAPGMAGLSRIDFFSDNEDPFFFATDFNILEVGPEGSNGAIYSTFPPDCSPRCEAIVYDIVSDGTIPEPSTLALLSFGLLLAGGILRRGFRT